MHKSWCFATVVSSNNKYILVLVLCQCFVPINNSPWNRAHRTEITLLCLLKLMFKVRNNRKVRSKGKKQIKKKPQFHANAVCGIQCHMTSTNWNTADSSTAYTTCKQKLIRIDAMQCKISGMRKWAFFIFCTVVIGAGLDPRKLFALKGGAVVTFQRCCQVSGLNRHGGSCSCDTQLSKDPPLT